MMKIFDRYKEDYATRYYCINYIVDAFRNDLYHMMMLGIVISLPDSLLITMQRKMQELLVLDDKTKYTKIMEFIIVRMGDEIDE